MLVKLVTLRKYESNYTSWAAPLLTVFRRESNDFFSILSVRDGEEEEEQDTRNGHQYPL